MHSTMKIYQITQRLIPKTGQNFKLGMILTNYLSKIQEFGLLLELQGGPTKMIVFLLFKYLSFWTS